MGANSETRKVVSVRLIKLFQVVLCKTWSPEILLYYVFQVPSNWERLNLFDMLLSQRISKSVRLRQICGLCHMQKYIQTPISTLPIKLYHRKKPELMEKSNKKYSTDQNKHPKIFGIPTPAVYLGSGGAIPFVSLAAVSCLTDHYSSILALGQLSYAACILTFLGGVHWGKELKENPENPNYQTLTYSVLPSLYAWSSFAMPYHLGLFYLSTGLLGVAYCDIKDTTLPQWYRKLRVPLTMLAASSVALTGYNIS